MKRCTARTHNKDIPIYRLRSSELIARPFFLALFLSTLLFSLVVAQPSRFLEEWRWREFTTESGLPSNHVYAILETDDGTPWVFTKSGVAWYDGYVWHPVAFPDSLPLHKPLSLYSYSANRLVVVHDSIVFIGDSSGFTKIIAGNVIHAVPFGDGQLLLLREDAQRHRWLEVWTGATVVPFPNPEIATEGRAMQLQQTESGRIWLSSGDCLFELHDGKWIRRLHAHSERDPLVSFALVENATGNGLVCVSNPYDQRGVWEWNNGGELIRNPSLVGEDVQTSAIASDGTAFLTNESGSCHLRSNGRWASLHVQRLSTTRIEMTKFRNNGDLWLCTDHGLQLMRYGSKLWSFVVDSIPSSHNSVNDILLAADSSLWLATGGGVRVLKRDGSVVTFERILGEKINLATGLLEDRERNIWVCSGSGFSGVRKWNGKEWERVGVGTLLDKARIHRMKLDKKGRVWMLGIPNVIHPFAEEHGPGAFVYENGTITRWSTHDGLRSDRVYALDESSDGALWFGTFVGISRWKDGKWKHWTPIELSSAWRVFTLAVGKEDRVWFSDRGGVTGYIDTNGTSHRITTDDGLLNEVVSEIRVDTKGRVWFTTPFGLSVFSNGTWARFDVSLGLRNAQFWPIFPLERTVHIGSNIGVAILSLDAIDQTAPRIVLSQPIAGETSALLRWRALTLWADTPPSRTETRYRVGNGQWSAWSAVREVNLTDLLPGDYEYEVQSRSLFGGDSTTYRTERSGFVITRPMMRDPRYMVPAISIVGILLAITLIATARARRLKQKQIQEELRRQHEHAERLAEVDRMKSRFFANLSHEFRTPLTLVLGPVEQALARVKDEKVHDNLVMIRRNARKLHGFINQLLEFSKVEAGTLKLAVSKGNVAAFVQRVVRSFHSWAEQKQILLTLKTDEDEVEGYFDKENLEKILNNLISNALKFTPEKGRVEVSVCCEKSSTGVQTPSEFESVTIAVRDSGIGIAAEHLPHIFDRFYRIDESHRTEGTGIGLALTKELVELHHGTIAVRSIPKEGTEFTVKLSLVGFAAEEIAPPEVDDEEEFEPHVGEERTTQSRKGDESGDQETIVMIVEDNADVRSYIRGYLTESYSILEVENGAEALTKARATIPDLVVSDVMMPVMNGYELCRELKLDERTSHIPVILLTARADMENKIEGLELGADDYLTKPFDAQELLVRIRNLIEQRRRLREKFGKAVPLKPGEVSVSSMDDAFLKKAIELVEQRMSDEEFSVEQLSEGLALSRRQLHRKLRALTNQSGSEFIRHLRLARAHELLAKGAATVSEIAFQTGFGSLSYFTRCYHEHYGHPPSEERHSLPSL